MTFAQEFRVISHPVIISNCYSFFFQKGIILPIEVEGGIVDLVTNTRKRVSSTTFNVWSIASNKYVKSA